MIARSPAADPDLKGRQPALAAVVPVVDDDVADDRLGFRGCAARQPNGKPRIDALRGVAEVEEIIIDAVASDVRFESGAQDSIEPRQW